MPDVFVLRKQQYNLRDKEVVCEQACSVIVIP